MNAQQMTKTLTRNEWYAIINGLRHMGSTYVTEHGGVNLFELGDSLAADLLNEQVTTAEEFESGFRPTDEQISFAKWYTRSKTLEAVFVAVNFPGKTAGQWEQGQTREAVLETVTSNPVFWINRSDALDALDTGKVGNAIFRVWADGHSNLVDEYRK